MCALCFRSGGSFAQSTSGGIPFYIRSSGTDVSASGSPARAAGVTMAISVSGAASPSKSRKTSATVGLVAASLSGARVASAAPTSGMSPIHTSHTSAMTSPFASTSASKTPNKIIKFHEYKGPPGVTSSSSSSSTMTSSHVSSSVISISSISWAGNNVTLSMPIMSLNGSIQQQSRMPLPSMQFLVQPNFSTSPSASATARVLTFDCRNPALPTIDTSVTSMTTTATTTTTTVKPLMTSSDRPCDTFPAGVLVTLPTTVTSPAGSSPVDEHFRIGNNQMVNGRLNCDSASSLVSGRNSFPVGSELLPVYQASPSTSLPRMLVGWSSPGCTASDSRLALGDTVTMSTVSSSNIITPPVSSVVSALHLTSSPHSGRLRLLPLDGYGAESQMTSCPVTSDSPVSRPPSVNQQSSSGATSSSPVTVKLHPRSTEQHSKAASSNTGSPSAVPAHLEDVRVADLKAECRKRCLAVSGPKPNLIARLKPYAEEILVRLAAVIAGNTDGSRQVMAEETALAKDNEVDRSPDVTLGVPPPVSGAVLDTSFHPLMECSSSPLTGRSALSGVIGASQLQSPIKALFSPSRQVNVSSPARIDNVYPVSSSSVVSSLFKTSSHSPTVSSAADTDALSPLVRRLFQTQASVFQPSIAASAAASIAVGGLLSNTGVRKASEVGSFPYQTSAACGFHYRNPDEIAVHSSLDSTLAQPLVGSKMSSQEFPFVDINEDSCRPNSSMFRGSVTETTNTSGVTSPEISEGISFDLSTMFCSTSTTCSSSADVGQLDMIDDVDDTFQREFERIGVEYLADSESRTVTVRAVSGLDDYLTGAASTTLGVTSSALSTASAGAPNVAAMSPSELLDWQRRQIRELQSLLEQSRMELMETQVGIALLNFQVSWEAAAA